MMALALLCCAAYAESDDPLEDNRMEKLEIINELVSDHWQMRDLVKELREISVPNSRKNILSTAVFQ